MGRLSSTSPHSYNLTVSVQFATMSTCKAVLINGQGRDKIRVEMEFAGQG